MTASNYLYQKLVFSKVSLIKWFFLKVKAISKLRMTPNFKVLLRLAYKYLKRTTLKNGTAELPFFKLCVL